MISRRKQVATLAILMIITLALHFYSHIWKTGPGEAAFMRHILADLCYIPIVVAAIWFGIRGAVLSSTIIGAFSFIFVRLYPSGSPTEMIGDYIEIIFFYLVGAISGIVLDRDRKLHRILEETERRAATYNRSLLEAALDPLVTIGPDGKITDVNSATELVTGLERGELLETDFSHYFTDPQKAQTGYLKAFREGMVKDYPLEIKHRDGHTTPVLYNASLYHDETGNVIGVFAAARDITERKKAQQEIEELATFPTENPNPVIRVDDKNLILYANPGSAPLLQFWQTGIGGKLPNHIFNTIVEGWSSSQDRQIEIETGDKTYWFLVVHVEGRSYTSIYGKDITERKRAENALRKSEERFRTLFEQMLNGFALHEMIFDENGNPSDYRFLETNSEFEKLTGLKRAYIIGKTVKEIIPYVEPFWIEKYGQVVLTGEPIQFEGESAALGKYYEAKAFRPEPGKFAVVFSDITARKKADDKIRAQQEELQAQNEELQTNEEELQMQNEELHTAYEELKKAEEALQQANAYNRSLLEASLDPLVTIGPNGKITDVNRATEVITGNKREKLIGTDFSDYFTEPYKAKKGYKEVFEKGTVRDYPLEVIRHDGTITPVLYNASLYRNEAGKVVGIFAAARDITERKKAELRIQANNTLLRLSAQSSSRKEYLDKAVNLIGEWIGCSGVGIRALDESGNIPYEAFTGLSREFWEKENMLSTDQNQCACIRVVTQEPDPQEKSLMTPNGSFFINDTTALFGSMSEEARSRYRGACFDFGYQSLAVTPIRYRGNMLGAIHYIDKQPNHVSLDTVEFVEMVSGLIGEAFHKFSVEEDLRRNFEALRLASDYNRSLIEASLDPLVTIGPNGKITDVNEATEKATGLARDELIGTDFSIYFTEPEKASQGYQKVFKDGLVRDYPLELKSRDGHISSVLYNATLYRDENENVIGVFAAARDITERKKAEENLAESERRFRALFNSMITSASLNEIVLDEKGNPIDAFFLEVNPAFEKMIGLKRDEIIGKREFEIFPIFDKAWIETCGKVAQGGESVKMDQHIKEGDRYFELTVFSPANGQFAVLRREVTDRKRAEQALRFANAYNRSLIEASLDPLVTIGPDGKITDVNEATEKATGLDRDELIGTDFSIYFTEPEKARDGYQKVFKDGLVRDYPLELKSRDGHIISVLYNATLYRDENENVIGIFAAARDITERKKLEQTLWRANELLESMFSVIDMHIVYLDKDFNFIRVNRAYAETCGYPEEYFVGKNHFALYPHEENEAIFREVVRTGKPFMVYAKPFEFPDQPERGATYWDWSLHPVLEPDGSVGALVFSLIDVTRRELAAQEIAKKNEALAKANSELQQFAYVASHDLQEPLRMIASYLQLIERRYKDRLDADANEFIAFAVDGAIRLQNMINSLLEYSRIESRGGQFAPMAVRDALNRALSNLTFTITENKARITNRDLPNIYGDVTQLTQLFQNLIANAIKFHGPEPPRINISAALKDGNWLFKVEDNGIGIDPQYGEKIFNIFQRLHGADYPGTGIGLALCKRIVERHGGKIWVESAIGRGSKFYFTVPMVRQMKKAN